MESKYPIYKVENRHCLKGILSIFKFLLFSLLYVRGNCILTIVCNNNDPFFPCIYSGSPWKEEPFPQYKAPCRQEDPQGRPPSLKVCWTQAQEGQVQGSPCSAPSPLNKKTLNTCLYLVSPCDTCTVIKIFAVIFKCV